LHLQNTQTTDAGLTKLYKLPYLEYLNLYGNPITDKGLALLTQIPHLQQVYLWQTKVTPAGITALQGKKQNLEVVTGIPVATANPEKPETQTN
jgi:hypothetical protein